MENEATNEPARESADAEKAEKKPEGKEDSEALKAAAKANQEKLKELEEYMKVIANDMKIEREKAVLDAAESGVEVVKSAAIIELEAELAEVQKSWDAEFDNLLKLQDEVEATRESKTEFALPGAPELTKEAEKPSGRDTVNEAQVAGDTKDQGQEIITGSETPEEVTDDMIIESKDLAKEEKVEASAEASRTKITELLGREQEISVRLKSIDKDSPLYAVIEDDLLEVQKTIDQERERLAGLQGDIFMNVEAIDDEQKSKEHGDPSALAANRALDAEDFNTAVFAASKITKPYTKNKVYARIAKKMIDAGKDADEVVNAAAAAAESMDEKEAFRSLAIERVSELEVQLDRVPRFLSQMKSNASKQGTPRAKMEEYIKIARLEARSRKDYRDTMKAAEEAIKEEKDEKIRKELEETMKVEKDDVFFSANRAKTKFANRRDSAGK